MTGSLPTPCRQVCRLGADQLCDGCGRTLSEIARWTVLTTVERALVMARTATWTVRGDPSERD